MDLYARIPYFAKTVARNSCPCGGSREGCGGRDDLYSVLMATHIQFDNTCARELAGPYVPWQPGKVSSPKHL